MLVISLVLSRLCGSLPSAVFRFFTEIVENVKSLPVNIVFNGSLVFSNFTLTG